MQKILRKALLGLAILCLSIVLVIPAQPANAAPLSFSDISNKHWAIGPINQWNNLGLIGGYAGNTFRPSQPITKAEFIAFVNRGFGFTKQATISFADVKLGSWFYGDIAKAVGRGYTTGNADGTFQPNKPLSRLEAAQMLHNVLRLEPITENALARFTDLGSLSEADLAMVNSVVANGYLGGYANNTLQLANTITRAEMIAILSRGAGEIMNVAATFGPKAGTRTLSGNATISKSGITLQNTVVKGDLYITEGVGEGDFYLRNVNVEGRTIVAGGGSNSGHVEGNSQLSYLMISYPDGSTHMVFADEASVDEVEFRSSGDVDTSGSTSATRPSVTLRNLPVGATVTAVGNFSNVNVDAPGVTLVMGEGSTAENVTAAPTATNTTINIQGNVTGTVTNSAPNATTNVAATATVANVTTTESATGSTTNVQGNVTGALTVNAPNATAAVTGTVNQVTTGATATGASLNVSGAVTNITLNAPQATVSLGAGSTVGTVTVAPGTTGVAVARDASATVGTIVVPEDTTIELDGEEQTGTITPEPGDTGDTSDDGDGGGGGGDSTPTIQITSASANSVSGTKVGSTWTFDLTGLPGSTMFTGVTLNTNVSGSYSVHVDTITAFGIEMSIDESFPISGGSLSITDVLTSNDFLHAYIAPKLGSNNDISLTNLKSLAGESVVVVGSLTASGYNSISVTVIVEVGGESDTMSANTPWGLVTVDRVAGTMSLAASNPTSLITEGDTTGMVVAMAGLLPQELGNIKIYFPGDPDGIDPFTADAVTLMAQKMEDHVAPTPWASATVQQLDGFTFDLQKGASGQVYTVTIDA